MACKKEEHAEMPGGGSGDDTDASPRAPDRHLLELLVCPLTKCSLQYRSETSELVSRSARLAYPIVDGVPLLVSEAARTLSDKDLQ